MKRFKIADIFVSIQGEGKYLGAPTVFVRLAGCDLVCVWCDTDYALREECSAEELLERVVALYQPGMLVSLTGGEPLLQAEALAAFLPLLKERSMPVYLETNGVCPQGFAMVAAWVDIVAMDFKLPSSAGCRDYWAEHRMMLQQAQGKDIFVKIVVTPRTSEEDMRRATDLLASVDPAIPLYLQPETAELADGALERCLDFQGFCLTVLRDVRVVPQVHRLLNLK